MGRTGNTHAWGTVSRGVARAGDGRVSSFISCRAPVIGHFVAAFGELVVRGEVAGRCVRRAGEDEAGADGEGGGQIPHGHVEGSKGFAGRYRRQ